MLNTGASIPIFGLGWAGVCTQQYFPKVCLSLHQHVAVSQGCCWRCCAGGNTRWLPPSWWCVDLQERGGDRSCTGGPLQGGCGQERGALHHIKTLVKIIITVWLAVWLLLYFINYAQEFSSFSWRSCTSLPRYFTGKHKVNMQKWSDLHGLRFHWNQETLSLW